MKKLLLFIFITSISLSGCSLLTKKQPAALKVTTTPQATIFIDGKHSGTTPYENKELEPGEITLKLVPEQQSDSSTDPFEGLIELTSGVTTIVNHEFATENSSAAGELLTLKPNNRSVASLSVVSQPDAAVVRLDGESKGFTPLVLNQVEQGDHQLSISSPGYETRTISIRTQTGYRLTVSSILGKGTTPQPITQNQSNKEATDSATPSDNTTDEKNTTTVTPTETQTTPSPKPTTADTTTKSTTPDLPYVKINKTPTGWLRVRSEPSMAGEEVAKINPGETYPFLDKQSGWYQIKLDNGEKGWIAGQYAELYE